MIQINELISKQAIIDEIWKLRRSQQMLDDTQKADLVMQGIYLVEKVIEKLPSVQPEPHWIPCSERLPEESGSYLCTCLDGHRSMVTQVKFHPRIKSWNLTGARAYWKVVAWQPLPEPWKGEKNE